MVENSYHDNAMRRIFEARNIPNKLEYPKLFKEIKINSSLDWFPSEPYHVIIDGNPFCANIKIKDKNIQFHLAAGYQEGKENPGQLNFFSKHFKHLLIPKDKVKIFETNRGLLFLVNTDYLDWERFYRYGDKEINHFWKRGGSKKNVNPWDTYDWYVDWLVDKNRKMLKEINKENYLENRSDGEKQISRSLQELGLRYIPEYIIDWLENDDCKYRLADFYLPREDIYIEFNGGWSTSEENRRANERKRYELKKQVYEKNNLKVLYLFPEDLSKIKFRLSEGISKIISGDKTYGTPTDLKQAQEILKLRERVEELESRRISNKIKNLLTKVKISKDNKDYLCEECGRPINHRGKCYACNIKAKKLK